MTDQNELNSITHVHFIGVYGVSVYSLAVITANRGYTVSGSDTGEGNALRRSALSNAGIRLYSSHSASNLPQNVPPHQIAVVHTAAVTDANPELTAAREKGMRIFSRAEFMELLTVGIPLRIGVAGTHGKSTVCGMLAQIFTEAGTDPDVLCGAELPSFGGAFRIGSGERIIYEACEYKNSFLKFHPTHAVVTNIEADHLDFFRGMEDIRASFRKYTESAAVTVCVDGTEGRALADSIGKKAVTCSAYLPQADYYADNVSSVLGRYSFGLFHRGEALCEISLKVVGAHNLQNAVTAAAAALENGITPADVKTGLESFAGVKRRMEYRGTLNGAVIYDDYAHHPTEIRATLTAAREMGFKKIYCAFQPHTYSRTQALFREFTASFSSADRVIFADIYAAREVNTYGISSKDLTDATPNAIYIPTAQGIAEYFQAVASPDVLLLTVGAGELDRVADIIFKNDKNTRV